MFTHRRLDSLVVGLGSPLNYVYYITVLVAVSRILRRFAAAQA
jgi:hypothetical protein